MDSGWIMAGLGLDSGWIQDSSSDRRGRSPVDFLRMIECTLKYRYQSNVNRKPPASPDQPLEVSDVAHIGLHAQPVFDARPHIINVQHDPPKLLAAFPGYC